MQEVDGQSFVSLLKNPARPPGHRALFWHHPHRWIAGEAPLVSWASAVRQGDWKLVYDQRTEHLELYNLRDDIGEQHDLSKKKPEKTRQMARLLTVQLKKWNAQMPVFKQSGRPVRWPAKATGL